MTLSLRGAAALRPLPLAALVVALALPALAEGDLHADNSMFNLFNDSSMTMTEFRTAMPDGTQGHNWLETPVAAGEGLTLEFTDPLDTRCEIKSRAIFDTGMVLEILVNYCGTARVVVTDSGMTFD